MSPEEATTGPPPVPDYELLRLVGRGSYGDVWLARSATGLFRAVKVVWRERFNDPTPYEREFNGLREFARLTVGESRQLALLHVGRNETRGFFYYVMELADDVVTGQSIDPGCYAPLTLRVLFDQQEPLTARQVVSHGIELARGLAELHQAGLVHRDIKPSNIILVDGRPKLADIGLISLVAEARTYVGTEGFVPPEGPGTPMADIYSCGKVLYELATNRDRNDFPRLPVDLGSRPDQRDLLELNEVILKACAPRAEDRYADADALLGELQLLEAGKSVRRLRFAEAGLARAQRWIAAALLVAGIAAIGVYVERQRADRESAGRRAAEAELVDLTRRSLYDSSIARAQRALDVGDFGLARETLELVVPKQGEPDLRGFEWHALEKIAHGDPSEVWRARGPAVDRLLISPDRTVVAVDNVDLTVDLYAFPSGSHIRSINGIHRLAGFTPDSHWLVGTTRDYVIQTWSAEDGSVGPHPTKSGINRPVAMSATENHLLYVEDSIDEHPHRIAIRDLKTGLDLVSWDIPRRDQDTTWEFYSVVTDRTLSRARVLASGNLGNLSRSRLITLNMKTGERLSDNAIGHDWQPIALSPDGRFRANYIDNGLTLAVSEMSSDDPLWSLPGNRFFRATLDFTADSNALAVSESNGHLAVFDTRTGAERANFVGNGGNTSAVLSIPDSDLFLTGTTLGELRLWDAQQHGTPPDAIDCGLAAGARAHALVVDQDGSRVAITDQHANTFIFSTETLTRIHEIDGLIEPLWFENGRIWGVFKDATLSVYDVASATKITLQPFHENTPVSRAAPSPNGQWLIVFSDDQTIALWDRAAGKTFSEFSGASVGLSSLRFIGLSINDEATVASIDLHRRAQIWNARTHEVLHSTEESRITNKLHLLSSPDWIINLANDRYSEVLDAKTLAPVHRIDRAYPLKSAFAYDAQLRQLIVGSSNATLRILNTETWKEGPALNLVAPGSPSSRFPVTCTTFGPDGHSLYAVTYNGFLRIWRW